MQMHAGVLHVTDKLAKSSCLFLVRPKDIPVIRKGRHAIWCCSVKKRCCFVLSFEGPQGNRLCESFRATIRWWRGLLRPLCVFNVVWHRAQYMFFSSNYLSLNAEWPGNSISILPGAIIHICVLSESVVQWRCKLSKLVIWSCDQQQASGQEGQPRTKDWVCNETRFVCITYVQDTPEWLTALAFINHMH